MQGDSKSVVNYVERKCATCEVLKVHRQSNKVKTIKKNNIKEQEQKHDHLLPVKTVSVDHYIS